MHAERKTITEQMATDQLRIRSNLKHAYKTYHQASILQRKIHLGFIERSSRYLEIVNKNV